MSAARIEWLGLLILNVGAPPNSAEPSVASRFSGRRLPSHRRRSDRRWRLTARGKPLPEEDQVAGVLLATGHDLHPPEQPR